MAMTGIGRQLRFEISSISGRTANVQCSAAEEMSWVLRSAAESLGFPWTGVGAYSLLMQNKLLQVHGKILDCPDLLAAGDVIVATLVRRAGISVEVVHPSFTLNGAASSNRANFVAATIRGLRQDMQHTLGLDFTDCQAVIPGLDLVVDEEADLATMAVEKINFVGHVKVNHRPAPSVQWVLRELPSGERYFEAAFHVNTSAKEKSLERSGYESSSSTHVPSQDSDSSSSESSVKHRESKGKCKGNGKGVAPPLPTKGKGKGKGEGMGAPTRRVAVRSEKQDVTALLTLVPGTRVLTRLRFTDEIGRDAKEGVVIGWCPGEGAWIVRMLNGMDWLVKTEHLMVRGNYGWTMARAPADENLVAVDHFDPEARTVVRVSVEEDYEARKQEAVAVHEESRRRTVEWAQQCALARETRIQALLIEGEREEICIGSVCPKIGSQPADVKWDPSILMTHRPHMVGRTQIPPVVQDLYRVQVGRLV
jgi:hypothetical protein